MRSSRTVLLDEGDTFLRGNNYLRSILDAAFDRENSWVWRRKQRYCVFANIIYGAIGVLPDTLADRSIVIEMVRKRKDEKTERFRQVRAELDRIRQDAAWWVQEHWEALAKRDPQLPRELDNRAEDAWRPLIACADEVGGEWPERARKSAIKISLTRDRDDQTIRTQLLLDLRAIFQPEGEPPKKTLTGTVICGHLNQMEDRQWADISRHNSPITPRKLSDLLRPFKIEPHSDGKRRLYRHRDFVPVFSRYLKALV